MFGQQCIFICMRTWALDPQHQVQLGEVGTKTSSSEFRGQPLYSCWWSPEKGPDSKNKVESHWEGHSTLTSSLHMHRHKYRSMWSTHALSLWRGLCKRQFLDRHRCFGRWLHSKGLPANSEMHDAPLAICYECSGSTIHPMAWVPRHSESKVYLTVTGRSVGWKFFLIKKDPVGSKKMA